MILNKCKLDNQENPINPTTNEMGPKYYLTYGAHLLKGGSNFIVDIW